MLEQATELLQTVLFKTPRVERHAYGCYLIDKLLLRLESGKPEKICILECSYSRPDLEKQAKKYQDSFIKSLFDWLREKGIPGLEILKKADRFFDDIIVGVQEKEDFEGLSSFEYFTDDIEELVNCICKYAPEYIDERNQDLGGENRRKRFSNADVLFYLLLVEETCEGKEFELIQKAKSLFLQRLKKEPRSVKQYLFLLLFKDTNSETSIHRKNNPLSLFRAFAHKCFLLIGGIVLIGGILLSIIIFADNTPIPPDDFLKLQEEYAKKAFERDSSVIANVNIDTTRYNLGGNTIDSADYWYHLAVRTIDNYLINKRVEYLTKALRFDPKRAEIYKFRANINEHLKLYEKAISDYTLAIKYDTSKFNYTLYESRGKLKEILKDHSGSQDDYETSLTMFLHNFSTSDTLPAEVLQNRKSILSETHYNIAYASYEEQNYLKAIDEYKIAISFDDTKGDYHGFEKFNGLALAYARMDSIVPAIKIYMNSLPYASDYYDKYVAYDGIVSCYKAIGDKEYENRTRDKSYTITHYENAIQYTDSLLSKNYIYFVERSGKKSDLEKQKSLIQERLVELRNS